MSGYCVVGPPPGYTAAQILDVLLRTDVPIRPDSVIAEILADRATWGPEEDQVQELVRFLRSGIHDERRLTGITRREVHRALPLVRIAWALERTAP